LLIKDLIAVFYLGLQRGTAFNSILKAAIVLVAHPGKPDRAAVFRPDWLCPAITLYGDNTVLQVVSWPFFSVRKDFKWRGQEAGGNKGVKK
jgi:hypothetical protein